MIATTMDPAGLNAYLAHGSRERDRAQANMALTQNARLEQQKMEAMRQNALDSFNNQRQSEEAAHLRDQAKYFDDVRQTEAQNKYRSVEMDKDRAAQMERLKYTQGEETGRARENARNNFQAGLVARMTDAGKSGNEIIDTLDRLKPVIDRLHPTGSAPAGAAATPLPQGIQGPPADLAGPAPAQGAKLSGGDVPIFDDPSLGKLKQTALDKSNRFNLGQFLNQGASDFGKLGEHSVKKFVTEMQDQGMTKADLHNELLQRLALTGKSAGGYYSRPGIPSGSSTNPFVPSITGILSEFFNNPYGPSMHLVGPDNKEIPVSFLKRPQTNMNLLRGATTFQSDLEQKDRESALIARLLKAMGPDPSDTPVQMAAPPSLPKQRFNPKFD